MKMNRELQHLVLSTFADSYPDSPPSGTFDKLVDMSGDGDELAGNMLYLEEHGLISSGLEQSVDGFWHIAESDMRITAKGFDYLADDGGLSAILNVVTVKFHDETLAKLEEFIAHAVPNPQDKQKFLARLRELPADATKHLMTKLLDQALAHAPDALRLIQNALS